jgi:hypothetical protein
VFLLVPLAYEWLKNVRDYRWRGAYLALAPSGLAVYAAYLWLRFGDPFLFYTQQGRWNRGATDPLTTFRNVFVRAGEGARDLFGPGLLDPSGNPGTDRVGNAGGAPAVKQPIPGSPVPPKLLVSYAAALVPAALLLIALHVS